MCAALLTIERVAYAWAWHYPTRFTAVAAGSGLDPVRMLEGLFVLFKVLQLSVFAAWCWYFGQPGEWPPALIGLDALPGYALIGIGQLLNVSVFVRLGRVGVFYGNRFGHRFSWQDGFPFSLLAHPQYVGTVMSIWGVFIVLRYPHDDWAVLPVIETLYYIGGACVERLPEKRCHTEDANEDTATAAGR
jgi:methylene-fatty-acyl-phospholipid synthase